METIHIISDLNSFGGAQNLVFSLCEADIKNNSIYTIFVLKGSLFKKAKKQGIKVKRLNPLIYLKLIIKAFKKKAIFHFHLSHAFYFSLLIPFGSKFYTEHNTTNKRRKSFTLTLIDRYLVYRTFNCIICISYSVQDALIKYLRPIKVNTRIVFNTVNQTYAISKSRKKILIQKKLENIKSKTIITMVARFSENKDQITIIRSLPFISNSELFLVGPGDNISAIKVIKDLNLTKRVNLPGQCEIKTIKKLLEKTHIYVQSSNWEGFGLAPLEAMSMAIPTIVNSIEGLNEISADPELTFSSGNFLELAEKINTLIRNKEKYKYFSELCWENSKRFNTENFISSTLKTYKEFS